MFVQKNIFKTLFENWKKYINEYEYDISTLPSDITAPKKKVNINTTNRVGDKEAEDVATDRKEKEKENRTAYNKKREGVVARERNLIKKGSFYYYKGNDLKMTVEQVYILAKNVGFKPKEAQIMTQIAIQESMLAPKIHNIDYNTGDDSMGLWQINTMYKQKSYFNNLKRLNKKYFFDIDNATDLYIPKINAKVAYRIFKARGFEAWGAYRDKNYEKFRKKVFKELSKSQKRKVIADIPRLTRWK